MPCISCHHYHIGKHGRLNVLWARKSLTVSSTEQPSFHAPLIAANGESAIAVCSALWEMDSNRHFAKFIFSLSGNENKKLTVFSGIPIDIVFI